MRKNLNKKAAYTIAVAIAAAALYASSLESYVLFHSMAELFSVVIAAGIFVIAWNTRKFMPNAYLLFIGIAYLYIAFIDLVHTLAYKGMGVFPGADANLPTQLWIAGRYIEAVSLFVAPFFLGKKLRVVPVVIAYFFSTALLLLSIYSGVFPDAYIEGSGLTPFKIASEYIISLILAAAIIYLRNKREYFEKLVLNLLIWSMITAIASEMAFTLYQDVYGFFNLLGHNFKIVSFYLIYAALIKTNLKKPYESLVHEIDERKQAQEEKIFKLSRIYAVISQINQTIVRTREKDTILSEACRIAVEYGKFRMAWIGMIDEETKLVKPVAFSGVEEGYLSKIKGISVDDVPEGRGLTGTAIREGRHYVCGDIEKDPRMALWREEALKRGYRSSMALPIRQFDKVIGAFSLYASVPDFFDPEEIYLLDEVTNDISFAMNSIETAKKKLEAEETLREHERVRQLFVEHSPAAIAMFDRDMKYIVASRRFLMDYNLGDQNVIGRSHYEVFPEISERWREIHRHCLAGAVEKSDAEPFPRADGKTDWVRWEIRPWFESRGQIGGIILFSEVITQRKQSEEEIKTINEELIAINRIIADITGVSRINEILEKVLDDSLDITGLEGGTICMVTPENTLQLAAHRNTSEATILDLTTNEIKIGDCLCGQCARDHKPLILSDLEAVLKYAPREETRGEDIRFHAAFPMIMAGRCLGVLCVFTRTDKKPEKRRLKILETVSSQIALAIQNARLFEASMHNAAMLEERVKERTAELEKKITEIKRLNRIFVDRELRMKELKEKIWELEKAFTSKKT